MDALIVLSTKTREKNETVKNYHGITLLTALHAGRFCFL